MSDEFDDDDLDLGDDSFDEFEGSSDGSSLADLWRNNVLFKFGAIAAGLILVLLVFLSMGGSETPVEKSMVAGGSDVKAAPGTEEVSAAYSDAILEENEKRVEQAQKTGASALPTPIDPPVGRLSVDEESQSKEDPLQRWRQLQEERLQREIEQTVIEGPVIEEINNEDETVQQMAEFMSEQMQAILETQTVDNRLTTIQIASPDFLNQDEAGEDVEAGQNNDDAQGNLNPNNTVANTSYAQSQAKVLIPAGDIVYAQLVTEADSDAPGPVLAEIMEGPMRGSRIMGSFQVQNDLMTLNFDTIVVEGRGVGVNAVAIDPNTTLTAMATDVDHRYIQRVFLPAAAAFVSGLANAVAESGSTTITIEGETVSESQDERSNDQEVASGLKEASDELSDILDDAVNDIQVRVRVASGTPMGLLFLNEVLEENNNTSADRAYGNTEPSAGGNILNNVPNAPIGAINNISGNFTE